MEIAISQAPRLGQINSDEAVKTVTDEVLFWIPRLFNIENTIYEEQAELWAEDLVREHRYIRVNEVGYMMKRFARYENHGRIDYQVLHKNLKLYLKERRTEVTRALHQQEKLKRESQYQEWEKKKHIPIVSRAAEEYAASMFNANQSKEQRQRRLDAHRKKWDGFYNDQEELFWAIWFTDVVRYFFGIVYRENLI